jgi:hypothetical protein
MSVTDADVRAVLAQRNLSMASYPRIVEELHTGRRVVDPAPPTDAERQQFIDEQWRTLHFRKWIAKDLP